MRKILILAAAAVALVAGASPARPAAQSRIVFSADLAHQVSGVVYRVAPNGHQVVLAHGWWLDARPTVSPDGKTVAYFGQMKGSVTLYEVGIGGKGRVRIGPTLPEQGQYPYLAWQPHGTRLALTGGNGDFWLLRRGHGPVEVLHGQDALQLSWSPDGRVVTVQARGSLLAFTPGGHRSWTIGGGKGPAAWSRQGLAAVASKGSLGVYSEQGRLRFEDAGAASSNPAWSANGTLAVILGHTLEVQTSAGRVVLRKPLAFSRFADVHRLVWDGSGRVVVDGFGSCACQTRSVDVRTGKISGASDRWLDPLSADGKLAIVTARSGGRGYSLQVAPIRGGAGKTYTHIPLGYSDGPVPALESAQFAGRTRTVVYASYDPEPFQNLYSVSPGGGATAELRVAPYATQPALSPDGSQVAYAWAPFTGLTCKGCASQIRVASTGSSDMKALTSPQDCTFDNNPAWSPDGTTILYSEDACDSPGELFTVPASGGAPHDLGLAGSDPAWGPSKIAYVGKGGVWTANPDGTGAAQVATGGSNPAWSADGRLAYLSGAHTVVVGSSPVQLPFAKVTSLAWSPDGTRFVVTASKLKSDVPDVYTIAVDGTDPARLTTNYDATGVTWR